MENRIVSTDCYLDIGTPLYAPRKPRIRFVRRFHVGKGGWHELGRGGERRTAHATDSTDANSLELSRRIVSVFRWKRQGETMCIYIYIRNEGSCAYVHHQPPTRATGSAVSPCPPRQGGYIPVALAPRPIAARMHDVYPPPG